MLADVPVRAVTDPRLRTTSICVTAGFGSRQDPEAAGGLAHLLEHVIMSGHAPGENSFSEHVERLGGRANAETGLEQMLFYAQVHADDADDVARRLLHTIENPHLDTTVLESERAAVLQELAAAAADPSDVVQDLFLARLFPGHPLSRPVAGTVAEVTAASLDDVRAGHRDIFLPVPMVVTVVGPHELDSLRAHPPCTTPPPRPAGRPLAAVRDEEVRWPAEFTWMSIGARSPAVADPRHAYVVLAHMCGGSPSSKLFRRLRVDKGLAYMFQAWDRGYREAGAWRVWLGSEPANCAAVVDAVTEALTDIATNGPGERDLAAARLQARMEIVLDMDAPLDHARLLGKRWTAGHSGDPLTEVDALDAVTADDVRRAAEVILSGLVVVAAPVTP
jgi:predicted Zn-dependent peptidase